LDSALFDYNKINVIPFGKEKEKDQPEELGSPAHLITNDEPPLAGPFHLEDIKYRSIPGLDIPNHLDIS
jgi:hypothetical protein